MQLLDLLGKPVDQLSDDELEERLNLLKRLKVTTTKSSSSSTSGRTRQVKSNKDKQIEDLLKNPDVLEALKKMLT